MPNVAQHIPMKIRKEKPMNINNFSRSRMIRRAKRAVSLPTITPRGGWIV
jgi:hypothetical protein